MTESVGLRRVLDRVAPAVRAAHASGSITPSSFATPLTVAAHALEVSCSVVVVATSTEAEQLHDALSALLGPDEEVALWPGWDTHPLERVSPDTAVMARRSVLARRLLDGERPRVLVASVRALSQVLPPEEPRPALVVRRGEALDRDDFVAALVGFGYRRESLVEHRAEIAVRGGIVDVWPAQDDQPVRLDLFGDELERLTTFDIANQRSLADLDTASMAPAREWILSERSRERALVLAESAPWGRTVFDRLAEAKLFDGMEGWMPLFVSRPQSFLDLVANVRCVVVEPERVERRLVELLDEERELAATVAATWKATSEIPLLHVPFARALEGRIDLTIVAPTGVLDSAPAITPPPLVQGDPARLAAHVRQWSRGRRGVVLTTNPSGLERMADQLRAEGLEVSTRPDTVLDVRLSVLESSLPAGFSLEDPALVVWSESDLTGRRAVHRAARTRSRTVDGFFVAQELIDLYRLRSVAPGHAFSPDTQWQREMEELFPYTLTADQAQAIEDVKADMERPRPMDRLVCADVGFGKTEIAVRAIFKAVQDNKQAAILVPTTLLASQHFVTLSERFAGFPVRVALLSRFVDDAEAATTIRDMKEGTLDVVVGTHRLLSDGVDFKDLGLLVVDEEQRFGVTHKEAIKARTVGIDVLTLSASPIPRTLEMAFAGIRDLSMVTTPPADRRPILTHVGEFNEAAVTEAIRRELLREGQVFYVHNRVHDIDQVARRVTQLVPDARVAIAHGQMDEGTLERVMIDFWQRRYDVLVCTTIVESGIDLPSVNTLIVDRAERLGLGQMHQLRGRVGRGGQRAYAYLFHPADQVLSETAYERLRTIGDNTALGSGFKIAMRDLEIRGAGNLLGHDQSGPVAAVGYDLYVQLVAEAVADAKGYVAPPVATVTLDVPGEAHLPKEYVEADDARLEAYRRLASLSTIEELDDLRVEWADRYGPLPPAAQGLLELAALRLECVAIGVSTLVVMPARPGVRSAPLVRISPLSLSLSQQVRLRRRHGSRAYDEDQRELRVELNANDVTPRRLRDLLSETIASGDSDIAR